MLWGHLVDQVGALPERLQAGDQGYWAQLLELARELELPLHSRLGSHQESYLDQAEGAHLAYSAVVCDCDAVVILCTVRYTNEGLCQP